MVSNTSLTRRRHTHVGEVCDNCGHVSPPCVAVGAAVVAAAAQLHQKQLSNATGEGSIPA